MLWCRLFYFGFVRVISMLVLSGKLCVDYRLGKKKNLTSILHLDIGLMQTKVKKTHLYLKKTNPGSIDD